jgi:hypothetical protein
MRPGVIITFNPNPISSASKTIEKAVNLSNSTQETFDSSPRPYYELSSTQYSHLSSQHISQRSFDYRTIHLPIPESRTSRDHQKHYQKPLIEPLEYSQIILTRLHEDS